MERLLRYHRRVPVFINIDDSSRMDQVTNQPVTTPQVASTSVNSKLRLGRYRKGAEEYAKEYHEDFSCKEIVKDGTGVLVLACNFCGVIIGARSDRIKEHLNSKRHLKLKGDARIRNLTEGTSDTSNIADISAGVSTPGSSGSGECSTSTFTGGGILTLQDNMNVGKESYKPRVKSIKSLPILKDSRKGQPKVMSPNSAVSSTPSPPPLSPAASTTVRSYCMKWETHGQVFRNSFLKFQSSNYFTDVKLMAGDYVVNCHKIVLAACSDYFNQVFQEQGMMHTSSTIIMQASIAPQLKALIDFMYKGEVKIRKEELRPLLKVAQELGVWGLAQPHNEDNVSEDSFVKKADEGDSTVAKFLVGVKPDSRVQPDCHVASPLFRETSPSSSITDMQQHGLNDEPGSYENNFNNGLPEDDQAISDCTKSLELTSIMKTFNAIDQDVTTRDYGQRKLQQKPNPRKRKTPSKSTVASTTVGQHQSISSLMPNLAGALTSTNDGQQNIAQESELAYLTQFQSHLNEKLAEIYSGDHGYHFLAQSDEAN